MYENVKSYNYEKYPIRNRFVHTINGNFLLGDDISLIAHCSSLAHPGFLTAQDMKKHNCYARNCQYLRKLDKNPFWHKWQPMFGRQLQKDATKAISKVLSKDPKKEAQISAQKAARIAKLQQERCQLIRSLVRRWMRNKGITEEQFLVVDVVAYGRSTKSYRINYVSDQPRNDAANYDRLVRYIADKGMLNVRMIHVVDKNDFYATIEEFHRRKKW